MKWKEIPTIRRLDYIVRGTDNMQSGYLYARFRKMSPLSIYTNPNMSDAHKEADFACYRSVVVEHVTWVNNWMAANGLPDLFTDVNSWRAIGADYDYFWELRSKEQFAREEAEARSGVSGRRPVLPDPETESTTPAE